MIALDKKAFTSAVAAALGNSDQKVKLKEVYMNCKGNTELVFEVSEPTNLGGYYNKIKGLEQITSLFPFEPVEIVKFFDGARKADKQKVMQLTRKFCPNLYKFLKKDKAVIKKCYRTPTLLIIVGKAEDYFLKIKH